MTQDARWEMRVEQALKTAAQAKAERLGLKLSEVTVRLWRAWLAEEDKQ